jgi:PAS domain S-box-containing protein
MPRSIYNQGNNTLFNLIISFLVVGLVLMVTTILFLDRIVLFRLSSILTTVSDIAKNSDISKRLSVPGKDELSRLANSINNMLASLELSQHEIQESRKKYKTMFMNTGTATLTIEENGVISLVNAEFEKLSGYSKEELVNKKKWMDFFEGEDLKKVNDYHLRRIEGENVPRNYESSFFDKDNHVKYICLTVAMIPGSKRKLISCLDITALKISEEKIKDSLKEKEFLIREIHHRVKNNMQVIISLLSLQSGYTDDRNTKDILGGCQNRVRSMGMIHESLYGSTDLSSINFTDYIKRIISELFISYGVDTNSIKGQANLEGISLGIDTAIPCGLLINELISNSLKHAFPEGRSGKIYVDFHRDETDRFILTVRDSGIGFPDELDFRNTKTLGLNLVNTLVQQLDATIELHKNGKTEFIIKFSQLKYNKRI